MVVLYDDKKGLDVYPPYKRSNREEYIYSVIYGELDIVFGQALPYDVASALYRGLRCEVEHGEPVPTEWIKLCKTQHSENPNWLQPDGKNILTDAEWEERAEEKRAEEERQKNSEAFDSMFDDSTKALSFLTIRK